MDEQQLRRIIEEVTAQVLASAPKDRTCAAPGAEKVLVIGDTSGVPREICELATLCGIEDYECGRYIAPYSKVIIAELTLTQLCDIALARPTDAACCAVIQALLNGKPVLLLESGLPHRAFAGKGSTALYAEIEGYVRKLSGFGVKMMTEARMYKPAEVPVRPAKHQPAPVTVPRGNGQPNPGSVITEEIALGLVKDGADTVTLPHGAILTPSAKDVFTKMKVSVQRN